MKNKILLLILIIILGGCNLPRSGITPISLPLLSIPTHTFTPVELSFPLIRQSVAEASLAPDVVSTTTPISVPAEFPTAVPTTQATVAYLPTASTPQLPVPPITLLFTGVIVPARCVQAAIDARGDANYVYDQVREIISGADLAIGTLNASLSDLSTHTGCIETFVLLGDSRSAAAASLAGFDVMSVATNHIKDCAGASCADDFNWAFQDTMNNLQSYGILPVGAGMNRMDALQPLVVDVKGIRFGFVSLGMIEPQAFAGKYTPGIAELNEENLRSAIEAARQISDVVIAMPHWGDEDASDPNSDQQYFAQVAVEAGADVVVGNHTHVVQAIQQIAGIDVFYGLGNFIFDQTWDLAHQQGVMLLLHFEGTDYIGYDLIPTHVDGDGTVHVAGADEAAEILQRIEAASQGLR